MQVVILVVVALCVGGALAAPPTPCPPSCAFDAHSKGCGVPTTFPNGTDGFVCPKALLFSAGFDSDMVLQRAPAKAAVYGLMVAATAGADASVAITVSTPGGSSYTVPAVIAPAPTYHAAAANYSASWKAYLQPAPAGGEYTITAVCTGCNVGTGAAGAARTSSSILRVTFGDVYFCSGQSNMALPNVHSYSAKLLQAQMQRGMFSKLRCFQYQGMRGAKPQGEDNGQPGGFSPMWTRQTGAKSYRAQGNGTPGQTWFNASYGAGWPMGSKGDRGDHPFFTFSATCIEFGRNLLEMLGEEAPPVGLIQSAIGGTQIEAWSPNTTTAKCQNKTAGGPTAGPPKGALYYGMVCPFVNMTVAGWVWYQGENNVAGYPGSSLSSVGYGCMQPRMVAAWRDIWSAEAGTTDPTAPFGLVTIAPSGAEGAGNHLSAFRWAQTANYGVLPNPAMPKTFGAQAYDLDDPWASFGSHESVCSTNASLPRSCTYTNNGTVQPAPCCQCGPAMASSRCVWNTTNWNRDLAPLAPLARNSTDTPQFMGSIHPRLKEPVGRRLAASLVALHYEGNGTVTGPTIAGCKFDAGEQVITVQFNKTLLKGDTVAITRTQTPIPPLPPVGRAPHPHDQHLSKPKPPSRLGPVLDSSMTHVCTGDADDCACLSWIQHPHPQPGTWTCEMPAANAGQPRPMQATRGDVWAEVAITVLPDGASIAVDTRGLNVTTGGVHAIKFGWSEKDGTCCIDLLENTFLAPCIPGSCGLMTGGSLLPANPYFATIGADGKCTCPEPQTCDGY